MPKRALLDQRPWLVAAMAAAVAFYLIRDWPIGELWLILLKGAGVLCLAAFALIRTNGPDGRLLALLLALSALGDMVLEIEQSWGAAAFFASHLAAITLYLRNGREQTSGSQKMLAVTLLFGTPLLGWLLTLESAVALYALALGGMAATAWMSRFSRYRVGIGAVLFVISDLLIFANIGPIGNGGLARWLVWPAYFAGQFLICVGVVQVLRRDRAAQ